jgi:hypothetical protein
MRHGIDIEPKSKGTAQGDIKNIKKIKKVVDFCRSSV